MKKSTRVERLAYKAIRWIGTVQSLLVHTALFTLAFALVPFVGLDRVLSVVTNVVSLEAIYLCIFLQMSVNRQHTRLKEVEEDVDEILDDTSKLTE